MFQSAKVSKVINCKCGCYAEYVTNGGQPEKQNRWHVLNVCGKHCHIAFLRWLEKHVPILKVRKHRVPSC